MLDWFQVVPGRLYVVGTLLPLAAFALLLWAGGLRALCRPFREAGGLAGNLYRALGGDSPLKAGAYLATLSMAGAATLGVIGLANFLTDHTTGAQHAARWGERVDWLRLGPLVSTAPPVWQKQHAADRTTPTPRNGLALEVGYKIDHLTAVVFSMVTGIGTLIFVFSLGYMRDETQQVVEDHSVTLKQHDARAGHGAPAHDHAAHLHRRGRFGRFFLFLSLFSFSMLNLVIADNLFQVFVSWELVGVCSFFLIGFYYERPSASRAANKAFIVNRVGDAGFLVGVFIAFTSLGTLNFEEMNRRVRSPERDSSCAWTRRTKRTGTATRGSRCRGRAKGRSSRCSRSCRPGTSTASSPAGTRTGTPRCRRSQRTPLTARCRTGCSR
jgi:NADH-quinone oxidoreductase subunit L